MKLMQIKLLPCDVDWIFSNGRIAAVGDDTSDLGTFQVPQLNICVQDDHPILTPQTHYKTRIKGGFGAVSELCDLIFLTHGQLDTIHGASI
jgi:3-deoxy-D-manno-octulosonate 8-phosphate phosphatase (KDO 8-P phosphatase)